MNSIISASVGRASGADLSTVQGTAAVLVLKKAMDSQAQAAAQLIAALPQPQPVVSGTLGTHLNTFA